MVIQWESTFDCAKKFVNIVRDSGKGENKDKRLWDVFKTWVVPTPNSLLRVTSNQYPKYKKAWVSTNSNSRNTQELLYNVFYTSTSTT